MLRNISGSFNLKKRLVLNVSSLKLVCEERGILDEGYIYLLKGQYKNY